MTTRRAVAIVGAGVIGTHHGLVVSQLADRLELAAVVDVAIDRAEKLAAERGGRPFASLAEALNSVDVDIVVVCVPTGLHGDVAIEALDAGKHVIVEKPAETTVPKVDEIIKAQQKAQQKDRTLVTVISQHRFDAATERVLAAIQAGELGRLTSGIASIDWWRGQSYYDSGDWRGTWELDGGGALMNQGVHTVDLLIAMMGKPVEVFAYTGVLAHERIEVEDVAVGVVRFESGALGVLHGTTAAYPGLSARVQVHGDRGSAVIDNDQLVFFHGTPPGSDPEERSYGSTSVRTGSDAGSKAANNPTGLGDSHRLQYLNFLAALDGTEPLRVDLETNRQAVALINGVYESARTGRPVELGRVELT
jgi:UDP-N-acetyl-2-amino-2-deoxyglucuronate dehydrogenase